MIQGFQILFIVHFARIFCRFGPRYFPIVHAYNKELRREAESVGEALGETVHHGVYAVVGGPNFESAAEVRMMRVLGADIVGENE